MKQIGNNLFYIYLLVLWFVLLHLIINPLYRLLIAFLFPNAVAPHQYEVYSLLEVELVRVRVRRYRLLLRLQMVTLLIFEVTKTASQIQVSVNAALCDGRARFCDSIDLRLTLGLVIDAHLNSLSALSHDTARVASIGHKYFWFLLIDIHDVRGATNRVEHHLLVRLLFIFFIALITQDIQQCWLLWRLFTTQIAQLVLSLRRLQLYIHIQKREPQPLLNVFLVLEALDKDVLVVLIAKYGHFSSTVPVKYPK